MLSGRVSYSRTMTDMTATTTTAPKHCLTDFSDEILLAIFHQVARECKHVAQYRLIAQKFQNVIADMVFSSVTVSGHAWTKKLTSHRPDGVVCLGGPTWREPWSSPKHTGAEDIRSEEEQIALQRIAPLIRELRISFCECTSVQQEDGAQLTLHMETKAKGTDPTTAPVSTVHCCSRVTHLITPRLTVWYNTPLFQRALDRMVHVQALHVGQGVLEHSPDPEHMSRMVRPSQFPDVFAARIRELNIYDILFESTTHMHDFITQFIRTTSLALYNVAGTAYEHLPAGRLHTLPSSSSLSHCTTRLSSGTLYRMDGRTDGSTFWESTLARQLSCFVWFRAG